MYVCIVCIHADHATQMEVRGQLKGVSLLLSQSRHQSSVPKTLVAPFSHLAQCKYLSHHRTEWPKSMILFH